MQKFTLILLIFIILISGFVLAVTSSSSINWLSRRLADRLYASRDDINTNIFHIYFNHSMNQIVHYNLTESDYDEVNITVVEGEKFVFGDELT